MISGGDSAQTISIIFIISILLLVIGYTTVEPLMKLVGAGTKKFTGSVNYFQVFSIGFLFLFVFYDFQSLMRSIWNVLLLRYIYIGTVFLILILDPVFIKLMLPSFDLLGVQQILIRCI